MDRILTLVFSSIVCASLTIQCLPALADDCQSSSGDAAIAACTRNINSGKFKGRGQAVHYFNRGIEYSAKGDKDRAIADFTQAISLDPKFAKAYNGRGHSYSAKGDEDRAIDDFTQAISLDPKGAKVYNNRGKSYSAKGDEDRAIDDYTQAISLNPKYALAYTGRGKSYSAQGDEDRAIDDYTQAISLDPKFVFAYNARGNSYSAKGDLDRAIADYTQAISFNPKYGFAYQNRGLANFYKGALPQALADISQASALDPKNAYSALWLDIVGQRNNLPSTLSQAVGNLDMTAWPAPVIRLFLGRMTPAAVIAAADDANAAKKKGQVCEANFYAGEHLLQKGSKDEATHLFRLAASDCPHGFIERNAANAELKALGAKQ